MKAEDFSVVEDESGVELKPVRVLSVPLAGMDLCLAIDSSRETIGPPLAKARVAAIRLVDNLTEDDRVAVVAFTDEIDFSKPIPQFDDKKEIDFTNDRFLLRKVINRQYGRGNAPLYDGLAKSVAVAFRSPFGNRAVILFSKGIDRALGGPADTGSEYYEPKSPITGATRAGIPIYAIGLGENVNRPYLEGLALLCGGRYVENPGEEELKAFFREIALNLKQRTLVVYPSLLTDRGAAHRVRLTLSSDGEVLETSKEFRFAEPTPSSTSPFIPAALEARLGGDLPEDVRSGLSNLAPGGIALDATAVQALAGQISATSIPLSVTTLQIFAGQLPAGTAPLSASALQALASQVAGGAGGPLSATAIQALAGRIPGGTQALPASLLQRIARGGAAGGEIPLSATDLQSLAGQLPAGSEILSATAIQSLAAGVTAGATSGISATALQQLTAQLPGGAHALGATELQALVGKVSGGTGAPMSATALQALSGRLLAGTGTMEATALRELASRISGGTGAPMDATTLRMLSAAVPSGTGPIDATTMNLWTQMASGAEGTGGKKQAEGPLARFVQENDTELIVVGGGCLLLLMFSVLFLSSGRKRPQREGPLPGGFDREPDSEAEAEPSTRLATEHEPFTTEASTSEGLSQGKESTLERTLHVSAPDISTEEPLAETDIMQKLRQSVPTLEIVEGPVAFGSLLQITRETCIGRHPDNDFYIDHPTVSRWHAKITPQGDAFVLQDLGSGNGTQLNGLPVVTPVPLNDGDKISLGEIVMVFRRE